MSNEFDLYADAIRIKQLQAEIDQLVKVLRFYANPETYHAIYFVNDYPCGDFEDDFDRDHGSEHYDRPMPGKRAREALDWVGLRG